MTELRKEDNVVLNWVLCIYYLIQFKKNEIYILINFSNEINTITPAYALKKLGFRICYTNVKA